MLQALFRPARNACCTTDYAWNSNCWTAG